MMMMMMSPMQRKILRNADAVATGKGGPMKVIFEQIVRGIIRKTNNYCFAQK